jgi:hypothetical protein
MLARWVELVVWTDFVVVRCDGMNCSIGIEGHNHARVSRVVYTSASKFIRRNIAGLRRLVWPEDSPAGDRHARIGPLGGERRARLSVAADNERPGACFRGHVVDKFIALVCVRAKVILVLAKAQAVLPLYLWAMLAILLRVSPINTCR